MHPHQFPTWATPLLLATGFAHTHLNVGVHRNFPQMRCRTLCIAEGGTDIVILYSAETTSILTPSRHESMRGAQITSSVAAAAMRHITSSTSKIPCLMFNP
jgi:hypothetical protein